VLFCKLHYGFGGNQLPTLSKQVNFSEFIIDRYDVSGGTGLFLKLLIVISSLGILAHIIFHITLAAIATKDEPYGYDFANCE
jgi:hypothetical protein